MARVLSCMLRIACHSKPNQNKRLSGPRGGYSLWGNKPPWSTSSNSCGNDYPGRHLPDPGGSGTTQGHSGATHRSLSQSSALLLGVCSIWSCGASPLHWRLPFTPSGTISWVTPQPSDCSSVLLPGSSSSASLTPNHSLPQLLLPHACHLQLS